MSEFRWGVYDAIQTYLTFELNNLANNANKLGSAISFNTPGTDRKKFMDLEINLASVNLSAQSNPSIYIWLIARTDGSNFEDGGDSVDPARPPDKIVPLREINGAQRVFVRSSCGLLTTPDQGKLLFGNRTGASLAPSGNTLKYYIYGDEVV